MVSQLSYLYNRNSFTDKNYKETVPLSFYAWFMTTKGINTLRRRQNGKTFRRQHFQMHLFMFNENIHILLEIPLKYISTSPINNM